MITVLFLGGKSVGARCLELLLKHGDAEVLGVVPSILRNPALEPQFGVSKLAVARGVPLFDRLDDVPAAALLVSVQYHAVLTGPQLARHGRCVNLHMAPLPEYRGANQFTYAILNGDREFGTTLHVMEPSVDAGPVLAQRRFPIAENATAHDLFARTEEESIALFAEHLDDLLADRLIPREQDTIRPGAPRHFNRKGGLEELKRVDPTWSIEQIARWARAFDMPGYEPAYIEHGGRRIYLTHRA